MKISTALTLLISVLLTSTMCFGQKRQLVLAGKSMEQMNYVQAIDGRVVGFTAMKFAFDNYELSRGMKHHMSCVADAMNQQGLTVELQGNTDSSGTERYNNWLGSKRAEAALNYMVETGADAGKLSATSQGESNPRSSNATQEGMADNRRVDFIIK